MSSSLGDSFNFNLYLYSIELPSRGIYKFTIFSFIHCANPSCENANDYILIKYYEFNVGYKDLIRIDNSKGRIRDEKWVLSEAYFSVDSIQNFFVSSCSKV